MIGVPGCASEGFPPGGAVDLDPPSLIRTDPAERAVNAAVDQPIILTFDDVIDPRQLDGLPDLILVNPDTPEFDIQYDEDVIRLLPQLPMIDGVTYAVTVLAGLRDRDGNVSTDDRTILFSTGGEAAITLSLVRAGIVQDSVPAAGARYRLENTENELAYEAVADSEGSVSLEAVAYGSYVATAWRERVRPEGWQVTEEPGDRDTFSLSESNRSHDATYRIAVVDTTPAVARRVEVERDRVFTVTFDDRLAGEAAPPQDSVRVFEGPVIEEAIPLDSIPVERARGRRLEVTGVERTGPSGLRITVGEGFDPDRVYRVEVPGLENAAGFVSTIAEGATFDVPAEALEVEVPDVIPSEPIPWPAAVP